MGKDAKKRIMLSVKAFYIRQLLGGHQNGP
jgi:hypothetical protein